MAFGNAFAERTAIEMTYEDKADVLRSISQKDENNISHSVFSAVYEGIKCALSHGTNTSAIQKAQTVDHSHTLFAAPELDICPGDTVKVTRFGKVSEFEVLGKPFVFATHQEIHLKERGLA